MFIFDIISFDSPLVRYIYLDLDFFRDRNNALSNYVLFFLPNKIFGIFVEKG